MKVYKISEIDWATPQWLFKWLNERFHFELDAAASKENALCDKYITENTLSKDWNAKSIFIHFPHVKNIADWIRKAYRESEKDKVVVCLLPVRTDTAWFHEYCTLSSEIMFLRGRLDATIHKTTVGKAGFPHMIVVFDGRLERIDNGHKVRYVNTKAIRERYES